MNRFLLLAGLAALVAGCGSDEKNPPGGAGAQTSSGGGGLTGAGANAAGGSAGVATGGSAGSAGVPGELNLPVEVLGDGDPDARVIAQASLALTADAASVHSLFVTCHRCGFYDAPEHEALEKALTKVKASLRIVGDAALGADAPWIDVTDQSVEVEAGALAHGGINGALSTVGFRVVIDETTRARLLGSGSANTIEFRFNGTDGNSNGYRIIDLKFEDAEGQSLSPATQHWADIEAEKQAPQASAEDVSAGQALWTGRNLLIKSPIVPRTIRAACNDCHASDGRDLAYFNYSNHSIVQRSRFHGLSEAQGGQIAAYLRAANASLPHVAAAAPWNPPFQPGPGLDQKPIIEWAAGAGIESVLADGAAFINVFVGKAPDADIRALTQAEVDAAMSPGGTLNTREMAVPLQFPDWNSWLPTVHPLDVWTPEPGEQQGLFETGKDGGVSPLAHLREIADWLSEHLNPNGVYGDWSHLTPDERVSLQGMLIGIGNKTSDFGGGSRGTRVSSDEAKPFGVEIGGQKLAANLDATTAALADLEACGPIGPCTPFSKEAFIERADYGLYHWMIVKQWELVHRFGLEDQAMLHGEKDENGQWVGEGEARGWPISWPSAFYVAPHMIHAPEQTDQGLRENYFAWEKRLISFYRTNQWYQLQMTINPGWAGSSNGPMDWPYHMGFTSGIVNDLIEAGAPGWVSAAHQARFQQIRVKLAQLANTDIPFDAPDVLEPDNLVKNQGHQSKAQLLFKLSPTTLLDWGPADNQKSPYRNLDLITPGLYLMLVNGTMALYNELYASTDPALYRRCDPNNTSLGAPEQKSGFRFCVDSARTPFPLNDQGQEYLPWSWDGWTTEQYSVWGAQTAAALGADPARVQAWSDWNALVWPP